MKKLLSLLFVFTLIACGGGSDDDESMGRTTDPLIGTWVTTYDIGEIDEETSTLVINANGTISDRTIPIDPPNCIFSCSGTWSNTSPSTDFNSLTQRYTFRWDSNICNPSNICEDDSQLEYFEDPFALNATFSDDFNSFTVESQTFTRQ